MPPTSNLIGRRFGKLVVLSRTEDYVSPAGNRLRRFNCQCDCGNTTTATGCSLTAGRKKSCRCLLKGTGSRYAAEGGSGGNPMFILWVNIRNRTGNPKHKDYALYGGRGIGMWPPWRNSFLTFFHELMAEIGPRPPGRSIDRIDNSLGYEPGNVRWATPFQQSGNTRRTRHVTFNGETRCIADWSRITGIKRTTIAQRLNHGWTVDEALAA